MGKLEASIRRKGKALSKLSHRFRDIVNDKFHFQGRKESSSETSASLQANGNRSSPDTPTNGVSTTVNGSSQNGTGSFTQNSSNTTNGGSFSKSDAHSPSSHGNDSTDPLSPRDREQLSPLASLREREVIREREHPRDISSTPWKPRGSVLINGTSGGGGGGLLSPEKKNKAASSTAAEDQGREEMTQSLADDGRVVPPEDLMKLQVNGTAIELFKQPLGSPLSAASSRSSPSTSIADSLAAAAAAAALDSDGPSHALRSNFASPSSSHRSSVMGGTLSPATRGDRPDGVPLFLRKQSDLHPPHRDRAASNASALASPTTGSSSLFASPGGYGRDEASTKWAQELAGLRQHVSQHSSDIEGQISDIESALSNADIGTIKARLELLEDLQRNKKSDVETRLMRLEAELQNMKQVQRSNVSGKDYYCVAGVLVS
jgi:hypothetical protein